jgi:excinuclease ABC subunit C
VPHEIKTLAFDPADAKAALTSLPQSPAVFALYGADSHAEPYIGRTPNLQSRLARLLQPSPKHPRRLHLASLVRRIEWQLTGSEFESLLAQFSLLEKIFGAKVLERMHLRHPAFVRFLGSNPYPRVTVTHRPSLREADLAYGPFPSRVAAERYAEEMLKLFLLRRCTFELDPDPAYPGCVYSEMKMCLAPCFKGCTDERYAEESAAVESFLATRGESRLVTLRSERDQASADLAFESAATLHAQIQRVEAVHALAAELVRPLSKLRAVILQACASPDEVAVFLFDGGRLRGPAGFSILGMRIQNEQSGSTSLFAQPLVIEPVPEQIENREQGSESGDQKIVIGQNFSEHEVSGHDFSRAEKSQPNEWALAPEVAAVAPKLVRGVLESRLEAALAALAQDGSGPTHAMTPPSSTIRQGHLALLKRWYYRPEAKRAGEIFFPDAEDHWPIKAILRGIGRIAAKSILPPPQS